MDIDSPYSDDYLLEFDSMNKERMTGGTAWEVLTRVELDVAYSSEKALNLEMLTMQVGDQATDFGSTIKKGVISDESATNAFELCILSGILNSEINELESFMASLQMNITYAGENLPQSADPEEFEFSKVIQEKLHDAEDSLKQSQELVADVKKLSTKYERNLSFYSGLDMAIENNQYPPAIATLKQHNVEQQRHFLQMLEKSLAREIDLEKNLSESRYIEEDLRSKLLYADHETYYLEETFEIIFERMFEAENIAEVLLGISKELTRKLQSRSDVLSLNEKVSSPEEQLRESTETSQKQKTMLQYELRELENSIETLKEDVSRSESRAESAEAKCTMLTKTNFELNEQLDFFRNNGTEKAIFLERKLKESETQLENAKTSVEAIEEQQSKLYSVLSDMEHMKELVSKAESRAESAESKCSLLTETNLELNEELGFLRSRLESLEANLNQADAAKVASAKDIGIRTKLITELVMKLALERERLQLQISALTEKNRMLAKKCLRTMDSTPNDMSCKEGIDKIESSNLKSMEEALRELSATNSQVKSSAAGFVSEANIENSIAAKGSSDAGSKLETVRSVEATKLDKKYLFMAILVLLFSVLAVYVFQLENRES